MSGITPRTDALARELQRIKAADWTIDLLALAQTLERELIEAQRVVPYAGALTEAAQNMLDMIRGSDFDGLSWSDYLGDEGAKVLSALAAAVASNPNPPVGGPAERVSGPAFKCCGASDPPCTDFDGSCKNPANYPPAKPAADEYTPGCNFPRCVCPDGKECSK
jgi:hypothetical protein